MTQELIKRLREEQENIIRYRQSLGADGDYLCQEAADMIESLERRLREAEKDAERFRRALAGYQAGIVQSSNGSGYADVFLEAALREKEGK